MFRVIVAAVVCSAALLSANASADVSRVPKLTATNPSGGVVDLFWSGLPYPSDYVILWQGEFDTMRPNTGSTELTGVAPGVHRYQVCEPGPREDVCTMPLDVIVS